MTADEFMANTKPCPFCGSKKDLELMGRTFFYALQGEHGDATVSIRCTKCHSELYDHHHGTHNYERRLDMLFKKWNNRPNEAGGDAE